MIFPFCNGQEDFLFLELLDFCWFGKIAIIKLNSVLELFTVYRTNWRLEPDFIFFFFISFWADDLMNKLTIIGKQKQTLRIDIKPPRNMEQIYIRAIKHLLFIARIAKFILIWGNIACRLVENRIDLFKHLDFLSKNCQYFSAKKLKVRFFHAFSIYENVSRFTCKSSFSTRN